MSKLQTLAPNTNLADIANEVPEKSLSRPGQSSLQPTSKIFSELISSSLEKIKNFKPKIPKSREPGPGSYDPISQSHSYSCIIMGKRKEPSNEVTPGPGDYKTETRSDSPSYSIGQSERFHKINLSPGPGDYDVKEIKPQSPSFKIGNSERNSLSGFKLSVEKTPGPGQYAVEVRDHSPSARIIGKTCDVVQISPGPADYAKESAKVYPKAAEYSLARALRQDVVRNNYPGPADYGSGARVNKSLNGTFSRSGRPSTEKSKSPGPNYAPSSTLSSRGGVIGTKPPSKVEISPGPGSYTSRDPSSPRGFSFSQSSKFIQVQTTSIGPSSYSPSFPKTRLQPSFSKSPRQDLFGCCTAVSLQSLSESSKDFRNSTPGPGAYTPGVSGSSPKFSIGRSPRFERISESPGPGDYSPSKSNSSFSPIRISLAGSLRPDSSTLNYLKYCEQSPSPPETRTNDYRRLRKIEKLRN